MVACPENALNSIELKSGKGADIPWMTMAVTNGEAYLSKDEACKRNFSTIPFETCKECADVCPSSAIVFPEDEGFLFLAEQVIDSGECSGCGVCAAVCPEKVIYVDELPELRGECINCGYCITQCPRIYLPRAELEVNLFGAYTRDPLGHYEVKIATRSKVREVLDQGQDGGFVTAALNYALENRIIDGAIVAGVSGEAPWKAVPALATTYDEVLASAGSKYSNSPNLALLKAAKEKGLRALAIVGLPCHIEGCRMVEEHPMDIAGIVKLSIGLFCKSNFEYEGLKSLIERKCGFQIRDVKKISVNGRHFRVKGRQGIVRIPLQEALTYQREGCKGCMDFTSRLSDFSVGGVGSPRGYSTVLARTKLAGDMLEGMVAAGLIIARELDDEGIRKIRALGTKKMETARGSSGVVRRNA